MATSNSQNVTLVASAEQHVTWPVFYETIAVENLGGQPVWIATDGSTATVSGANLYCVPGGGTLVVANRQPKLKSISSAPGSTAQQLTNPASGALTFVSLISSGTPQVVVSPQ